VVSPVLWRLVESVKRVSDPNGTAGEYTGGRHKSGKRSSYDPRISQAVRQQALHCLTINRHRSESCWTDEDVLRAGLRWAVQTLLLTGKLRRNFCPRISPIRQRRYGPKLAHAD
jgi:hypothetical protein